MCRAAVACGCIMLRTRGLGFRVYKNPNPKSLGNSPVALVVLLPLQGRHDHAACGGTQLSLSQWPVRCLAHACSLSSCLQLALGPITHSKAALLCSSSRAAEHGRTCTGQDVGQDCYAALMAHSVRLDAQGRIAGLHNEPVQRPACVQTMGLIHHCRQPDSR